MPNNQTETVKVYSINLYDAKFSDDDLVYQGPISEIRETYQKYYKELILKSDHDSILAKNDKEIDQLNSLVGIEFHACKTGDCPHEKQTECDAEINKLENRHGFCPFTVTGNGFSKQLTKPMRVIDFKAVQVANQKYIDLESEFTTLKEKLTKAVKGLEFYADEINWFTPSESKVPAYRTLIDDKDIERFERKESHQSYAKRDVGGKLARSVLQEIK